MDEAQTLARGGQPRWEHTFEHPALGSLTFKREKLPRGEDWLAHAVATEQIAPGSAPGSASSMFAQAVAGLTTLLERPVISEERVEDPDNASHDKIVKHFYDPLADERYEFPMLVWATFMNWRDDVLSQDTGEQVKNSSGATTGEGTSDSSPATTDSPPPIPA